MLQCNVIRGWFCRFESGTNRGVNGFSLRKYHENLIALTLLRRAIYFLAMLYLLDGARVYVTRIGYVATDLARRK
jgi:hypothetical protein